jgi:hypothetical protein
MGGQYEKGSWRVTIEDIEYNNTVRDMAYGRLSWKRLKYFLYNHCEGFLDHVIDYRLEK